MLFFLCYFRHKITQIKIVLDLIFYFYFYLFCLIARICQITWNWNQPISIVISLSIKIRWIYDFLSWFFFYSSFYWIVIVFMVSQAQCTRTIKMNKKTHAIKQIENPKIYWEIGNFVWSSKPLKMKSYQFFGFKPCVCVCLAYNLADDKKTKQHHFFIGQYKNVCVESQLHNPSKRKRFLSLPLLLCCVCVCFLVSCFVTKVHV